MLKKMPPIEKIPEAWSALADCRVTMEKDCARVLSSNRGRTYSVQWKGNLYCSDDSASFWQSYPGYPVIAVLMLQGLLPLNQAVMNLFAGINWNELNSRHKRNYAAALAEVLSRIANADAATSVRQEMERVYRALANLDVILKRKL